MRRTVVSRDMTADYIRGYAVMAFLSVFLITRFWSLAKDAVPARTVFGWSPPDLLVLDLVYLALIIALLGISVILGLISFLPWWHHVGMRLIRATSLGMGIIALVSFTLEWEQGFLTLKSSGSLPALVLSWVYYLGLGWFIILATITAIVPLFSRIRG